MLKLLLTSVVVLCVSAKAKGACECGYKTNTGDIWQYKVETDFSQLNTSQWQSDWESSDIVREATVDLNYTSENVVVADGKLQLTCSAYNASAGEGIRSGQIRTTRRDILLGSFRASYSVLSRSPGSVAGFFFYANDTQEIDIEIQSKMTNQTIHTGNQPTQSADVFLPNQGVVTDIHNYRFDWLEKETRFYLDSVPAGGFTIDTPVTNGTISFNMWGNGGTFSGPATPTTDNIMSISNITIYFNTSSSTDSAKWKKACKKNGPVCVVDTQELAVNNSAIADTSTGSSVKGKASLTLATLKKILPVGIGAALFHI